MAASLAALEPDVQISRIRLSDKTSLAVVKVDAHEKLTDKSDGEGSFARLAGLSVFNERSASAADLDGHSSF